MTIVNVRLLVGQEKTNDTRMAYPASQLKWHRVVLPFSVWVNILLEQVLDHVVVAN